MNFPNELFPRRETASTTPFLFDYPVACEALRARLNEEIALRQQSEQQLQLQARIGDSLRQLTDPDDLAKAAFQLLIDFLPASRIDYAEIDDSGTLFVIRHAWQLEDLPSTVGGSGALDTYGSSVVAALREAHVVMVDDVHADLRTAAAGAAYEARQTRACMLVPVTKAGKLVALLTLRRPLPCQWRGGYNTLLQDVAERIWNAHERADAHACQREAELALSFERRAEGERLRAQFARALLAKEALDNSRTRLAEGMLAARMAIWDWDMASEKITFSQNTGEVFGCTWSTIADVWNAICEEDLARLTLAGEAAEAVCGSYEEVVRIKRAGFEKPLWLQIHGKFIADQHGVPRTMRSVAIDVTGLKDAQMALHDADARKDEFLAMLAHELRNPLAPIRAGAQLLGIVHNDARQVQRTGAIIARQVDHLTGLIDDMLDVSRVTSGLVTLDQHPEDIWSIVGEAVEQVMPLLQERFHRLSIDNPGTALMVMGDRKRLVQVLVNLLQNAAKYTPPKGHIRLEVARAAGEVAVKVSDDGIGMDAQLLPHVFELFSQQKQALDRADGGLGLGLALVARLVALHGGRVLAESTGPACGSAFSMFLPCLAADAGVLQAPAAALPAMEKAPLRLMVVDDNIDAANALGMWLESFGHHVQVAHSSGAVLEQLARSSYDVYILDIGLPGIDGNALARRLRQSANGAGAVLIANTGYGGAFNKAEALAAGFDHYFVKPVNLPMLKQVLERITQRALPVG